MSVKWKMKYLGDWFPHDATWTWRFWHLLLTLVRFPVCRLHVEGRENVPRTGGVIIAANHPGHADVILLGYASPRQIFYMAKQELFQLHPLFSALIISVGAFPVRRGHQDLRAIGTSIKTVRQGKVLGMFPEGTRNRERGLTRGHNGAVRIALQTNCPIVPTAVFGISDFSKHWSNPLRRPLVTVKFGKPICFPQGGHADQELLQQYTDQLMFAIAELLPPELRGVYAVKDEVV
jgi:1-acyl-sn-glycerol-3-phosphate acyltransferase